MSVRPFVRSSVVLLCAAFLVLGFTAQTRAATPLPVSASERHSQNVLRLLGTVTIPGTPASQWCYDTAVVDDSTYYLADNDRAGIDLIHDGKQPAYQGIIGKGQFTGNWGLQIRQL